MESSEALTQVESKICWFDRRVTHPIGRDRAKVVAREGKEKEVSSSQSESSSAIGDMMSTLKKLSTSFTKTQL
jgi:hypothetical protein